MCAVAILALSVCLTALTSQAQTPTVYRVTITKVELSSDGGATFITVCSGSATFDLASVTAGAKAGSCFSGPSPLAPNTTYNRLRTTLSCTIALQGSRPGPLFTNPLAVNNTSNVGPAVEADFVIPGAFGCVAGEFVDTQTISFTTDAGSGLNLTVRIDVTGTLQEVLPGQLGPAPPNVTIVAQ